MSSKSDSEKSAICSEKSIMETYKKFLNIASVAPGYIAYVNADTLYYEYVNEAFEKSFKRPKDQIIGHHIKEIIGEENYKFALPYIEKVRKGKSVSYENHFDIASGRRWIQVNYTPFFNESGCVESIVVFSYDITERKNTEIHLAERNKFVESIMNNTPDILYIYDIVEKKNIYSNDGIQKILGYSAEEMKSMGTKLIETLMHPDDLPEYLEKTIPRYFQLKDNEPLIHQYRMKHKSGQWRWLYSNETIYLRQPDGAPRQIFGMIHDITESKLSEEALKASEEKYRSLFQEMKSGCTLQQMIFNDAGFPVDYVTTAMNPAAEKLLGIRKENVIGKSVRSMMAHDEFEKWLNLFGKVVLEGISSQYEQYSEHNNRFFEGSVFRTEHDKFAVIFDDISLRKKAEDTIQNSQKLESLGILAGGIAHDFNNLLGGIFGYIDLALEESTDESVSNYLSKTMNTIDRARSLTQQLLTFAKGGTPVKKSGALFPFILETAQFALSGSNVSLKTSIASDLWVCDFDKNQIGQVIDNIIINAQQAMPVGGTIDLTAQNKVLADKEHPLLSAGNYVMLSIKDSGTGISREHISRIFDPFFSTKTKGHGLGLATCYSIIKRHGGCIDVESELGKGSEFYVYLPAGEGSEISADDSSKPVHKGNGVFLIMDDEEVIRETIGQTLKSLGYTVVYKESGREAIDYFLSHIQAQSLAGMIFDLTVPGDIGGKAAAAEIRKHNTCIPIFVISGYADDPVMQNPEEHGFTASLCKPFKRSELINLLNTFVKQEKY